MLEALLVLAVASPAKDLSGIQWIHDDWGAARQTALKKNQLVGVDVWATWCHTCLSMKNYVLEEAPLRAVQGELTWLALDYDKEKNGAFFEKFPITVFPTFMVIDPKKGEVVARWAGSGTAEEMAAFFGEAGKSAHDVLARGQQALARGRYAKARKIFEAALTKEKLDAPTRTRIVSGLMEALYKTDKKACAEKMPGYFDRIEDSVPGLDVVAMTAYCAESVPEKQKKAILAKVVKRLEPVLSNDDLPLSVDDRSSYYGSLIEALDALGDEAKARTITEARLALLEAAAKEAATPEARATFDYHRMEAYLRLKKYAEAEQMLLASEKAQPKDFNHPWRLALVYLKKKDYDRGLAAIDRALANGYGGRKIRLYSTKLDLLLAKKDYAGAKATVAAGKKALSRMNPQQLRDAWKAEFEAKVKAAGAAPRDATSMN